MRMMHLNVCLLDFQGQPFYSQTTSYTKSDCRSRIYLTRFPFRAFLQKCRRHEMFIVISALLHGSLKIFWSRSDIIVVACTACVSAWRAVGTHHQCIFVAYLRHAGYICTFRFYKHWIATRPKGL